MSEKPGTLTATGQVAPQQRGPADGPMAFEGGPKNEYEASLAALDAFQAGLGQTQEGQDPFDGRLGSTYDGLIGPEHATRPMTYNEVLRTNAEHRGLTADDEMVPASELGGALQRGEDRLRDNAERWYREKNYPGIPTEEGDLFDNDIREAGQQAVDSHNRVVANEMRRHRAEVAAKKAADEREMVFFGGERTDNWDAKMWALDGAFDLGRRTDNWDEFDFYSSQLRRGERVAYDAHREQIDNPPAPEPEPTEPDQPTPPVAPTEPGNGGSNQGGGRRRLRDRLPQWPRGRRTQTESDQDQTQDGEQAPGLGRRAVRGLGRLASGAMTRVRDANARRAETRAQREALESEWLDDEAVASYYQLDKYGLKAPAHREEAAPKPEEDEHDKRGRAMVAKLFEQGAGETDKAYKQRLDDTYNDNRRYYRGYSDRHPFSPNFDLTGMANRLAGEIEADHADEQVPESGTPYTRLGLINHVRRDYNVTRWEAAAIVDTLQERGFLTQGPGRGRKAQLVYGAPEAQNDSQE